MMATNTTRSARPRLTLAVRAPDNGSTMTQSPSAAERALTWIEDHVHAHGLTPGDTLPGELEIAEAAGVGRSSVREALTVLKVLGIIESRRKEGIRIVRDPVLLELRHYFARDLDAPERFADALEFRAAMEWGLGPVMLARVSAADIRMLRAIVREVEHARRLEDVHRAEVRFHTVLTAACGNRLGTLFSHLYAPLFMARWSDDLHRPATAAERHRWVRQHEGLINSLERRDRAGFLRQLKAHAHPYMRLDRKR